MDEQVFSVVVFELFILFFGIVFLRRASFGVVFIEHVFILDVDRADCRNTHGEIDEYIGW